MAIIFLTSSPTGPLDGSRLVKGFDTMNGFEAMLKTYWKPDAKCLMITAFPEMHERSEIMTGYMEKALRYSELEVSVMELWDDRKNLTKEEVQAFDVILLGGGHVPTQRAFFEEIGLREKLRGYEGIVIGISAGTMNSAETVYAQPEEPGEGVDPSYEKYFPGLGLAKTQILPHYQMVKDFILDGKRLYEEITYADSFGHRFLALPDGSFLFGKDGKETVYGEAYLVTEGKLVSFCRENEHREL